MPALNRYGVLLEKIFFDYYDYTTDSFEFDREEIERVAGELDVRLPKNLGDLIYSFRFRTPLPESIRETAPAGLMWAIKLAGKGRYRFALVSEARIVPQQDVSVTKVPDATPAIIAANTLGDEQAVLARIRYNRLIDIFLSVTAYSLQNHLRTTVPGVGQVEVDEIYVAVDHRGAQFVVPVQAKGGSDQIGIVQAEQDLACCAEKFPGLIARPVAAQFLTDGVIVLFELTLNDGEIAIVQERHYKLVAASEITPADLAAYAALPASAPSN